MKGVTTSCLTLTLLVVVYNSLQVSAAPADKCLLKCMRDVLKCKRLLNVGVASEIECCEKYTMCYYMCRPGDESGPSCGNGKDKRGSWNKRVVDNRQWPDGSAGEEQDFGDLSHFY